MTPPTASNFLELRHASTDRAIFVVVPERSFLAIDGIGEPAAADFRLATSELHATIELILGRLRRARLATGTRPGVVECAWSPPRALPPTGVATAFRDRSRWHWRQMIELPARATEAQALVAIEEARLVAGRSRALVRCLTFTEGQAAQLLHVGPRNAEPLTVDRLLQAIEGAGFRPHGELHALQLADADFAPHGVGRSILRQPIT